MKIFWFHSGLMPMACEALGYEKRNSCGWLESMLNALLEADPTLEFCLMGWDWRQCDIQIGRVRYVSFAEPGLTWYKKIPVQFQQKAKLIIEDFNPDLIHVQGTEYFYGCFDQEVYCGKPVVVSIQGLISGLHVPYSGGLSPDELRGTNWNLRALLKGHSIYGDQRMWREGRATQEEKILRFQQNFIGRTAWDENVIRYFNPHARYFSVNENLRPELFAARRTRTSVKPHSIYCSASSGAPFKGAHWLIRAVASLKEEFPDIDLRIAAANGLRKPKRLRDNLMDQSYNTYLRRLIGELGVADRITLLPSLPVEEVKKELEQAELYVLPSMGENSSNSLCEAMLVGTPAIATFAGGTPSMIKDGEEGLLVPPTDPYALAGAIRYAFLHGDEMESMAAKAQERALKRHDAKANAEATLAVYKELLGK